MRKSHLTESKALAMSSFKAAEREEPLELESRKSGLFGSCQQQRRSSGG